MRSSGLGAGSAESGNGVWNWEAILFEFAWSGHEVLSLGKGVGSFNASKGFLVVSHQHALVFIVHVRVLWNESSFALCQLQNPVRTFINSDRPFLQLDASLVV